MDIPANSRLVMIGDSITDTGRKRPIGEGRKQEDTGKGYVSLVAAMLDAWYPAQPVRVTNMGISGNTVRHLDERWQSDVLDLKPDWLSIMIGINDVWRQFDQPLNPDTHVLPDEYRSTLDRLLTTTRPTVQQLVLMSPFFIETNKQDPMRARMDEYGAMVKELADKHDCRFVDVQAAFDAVLEHQHACHLAADRVHPGLSGHMVIARAFLAAVGHR